MALKQEDWLLNRLKMSFVSNIPVLFLWKGVNIAFWHTCLVSAFYFNSIFFFIFFLLFFLVKKSNISLF